MKLTRFLIRFFGALALLIPGVAFSAAPPPTPDCPAGMTCYDLTAIDTQVTINGAIYATPSKEISGTGLIDSFVRVQATGSEQGYNTSDYQAEPDLQYDEKAGSFTHDLLLVDLDTNTVIVNGVEYIEFVLDINQTTANPFLSLDQLKIYSGPDQATDTEAGNYDPTTGQLGSLSPIYDLDAGGDNMVMLNYLNFPGSGNLDMLLLIPKSLFCSPTPNAPVCDANTQVYLYSEFGSSGGDFASNDGFEEWAHKISGTFTPEPGAIALLLIGLAALGWVKRRRLTPNGSHTAMC